MFFSACMLPCILNIIIHLAANTLGFRVKTHIMGRRHRVSTSFAKTNLLKMHGIYIANILLSSLLLLQDRKRIESAQLYIYIYAFTPLHLCIYYSRLILQISLNHQSIKMKHTGAEVSTIRDRTTTMYYYKYRYQLIIQNRMTEACTYLQFFRLK